MIRALLDTNIILDALFAREHFGEQAAALWKAHEDELFTGCLCAITPVNVFYIARKEVQQKQALRMMNDLMGTFEISPINRDVLNSALGFDVKDFEDAVQIASALADGVDVIVTRDTKDYRKSPVKVLTPVEFLKTLGIEPQSEAS
jgi:predicted nucleic acid-binding protein